MNKIKAGRGKIAAWMSVVILIVSCPFAVSASSTKEQLNQAERQKAESEAQVNAAKGNVSSLEDVKDSLQGQLSSLSTQLSDVSNNLEQIESEIKQTETEIEETQKALDEAQAVEADQYASMKKRIQFMYERGSSAYLEMLFESKSFGDFLNKTEYISELAKYDREKLEEYKQTREKIAEEEKLLNEKKETLAEMQAEAESEHKKVSGLVSNTSNNIAGYADQIAATEAAIAQKEAEIKAQDENIAYLKKKLAEEQALSNLAANSSWRDISQVSFDEGDRYLLANLIYCEAGGEPYAGQVAVGAVVINRVLSSVYPDTVVGVIYQNKQFSPVASGRLALALAENRATASCYQAADEAMSGMSNVGNCVYFRTPIPGLTGMQIGGHIFY